jgi:hypothetical protein
LRLEPINALGASFTTPDTYDIVDSLLYLDDDRYVYPVGHHIGLRHPAHTKAQFINMADNVTQITCMRLSPNKRVLLVASLCAPPT